MFTTLFNELPDIYKHFLPDVFNQKIPVEQYADCADCNMCKSERFVEDLHLFSPNTKCCTFKPIIPNYLIGSALNDTPSNKILKKKIKENKKIFPLGFFPTDEELKVFSNYPIDYFGTDKAELCEFYDDGNCGIWKFRNNTCSTYFCHHYKGFIGKDFWFNVRNFLQFIEEVISEYCCDSLDIPFDYINLNSVNFLNQTGKAHSHAERYLFNQSDIWGKWAPKKEAFFKECAALTKTISTKKLISFNPTQYKIKLSALKQSYKKMMELTIPNKLMFNPKFKIIDFNDQHVFFYHVHLLKMPKILKDIVPLFNGKQHNEDVIKQIYQKYRVNIDLVYVRHLYEQKILVD